MEFETEFPLWLVFGTGTGVFLFFWGFRAWRLMRLIEDTPSSKVRSMPMGRVEVQGRAQGKAELEAALTGTACVYYRYEIEQEVRTNKRRSWRTVAKGDSAAWGLYLEDETGRVLVDPTGAQVDISRDWQQTSPELTPRLQGVLAQHGVDPSGLLFRKKLRFSEWRIAPGDPVYVLGVAQERAGLALERRRRITEKLAAIKSDPEAMAHLDTDGDGKVDAEEWEVARQLVVHEVRIEGDEDRVAIARAPNGESPFYMSDRPEGHVLSTQRLRARGGVFGGAGLALASAAGLLHHFGLLGGL
jgi:hypothetical protein